MRPDTGRGAHATRCFQRLAAMTALPASPNYRDMLRAERFYYGVEVVTTRGAATPYLPANLAPFAQELLENPRVGWISVTDNPGGAPMLPPDWLTGLVPEKLERIVVHLTCKDMNRNALEAAAWRYAAEGCPNILAITGDYPTTGFGGTASPVFDIDSVGLIALLRAMNAGLKVPGRKGTTATLPPTHFFTGCVVSPFKYHEREVVPQYFKLVRKLAAGAEWVIPQLGYDMRKFHEVKLFLAAQGLDVPLVGNVYVLNRFVAKLFNRGALPGCVVSDELAELCEKYAAGPHRGQAFFHELAAKQLAVFKGLGFAGGYLGGVSNADTAARIIELAESYGANDWREFLGEICFSRPGEFFFFEHDPETGLSDPGRINPVLLESLEKPGRSKNVTLGYRFSRLVHRWFFERGKGFYPLMQRIFRRWDKKPGMLARASYAVERGSKFMLYGCEDCGDCSLPDCAYLCPNFGCAKSCRNGPCGGSLDGVCELGDRQCLWTRVYERLRHYHETDQMRKAPTAVYDASLRRTSAWANTYLDRDHHAPGKAQNGNDEGPMTNDETKA